MMPTSNTNSYGAVDLDAIVEHVIGDAMEPKPYFITDSEKKIMAALRRYTKSILEHSETHADEEEMFSIMEEHAGELLDAFYDASHDYVKNGMKLGASLLLQLVTLS